MCTRCHFCVIYMKAIERVLHNCRPQTVVRSLRDEMCCADSQTNFKKSFMGMIVGDLQKTVHQFISRARLSFRRRSKRRRYWRLFFFSTTDRSEITNQLQTKTCWHSKGHKSAMGMHTLSLEFKFKLKAVLSVAINELEIIDMQRRRQQFVTRISRSRRD